MAANFRKILSGGTIASLALMIGLSQIATGASARDRKLMLFSFQDLVVEGGISVKINNAKSYSAIASGEPRMLEQLRFEQNGNMLTVSRRNLVSTSKSNSGVLSVTINAPTLRNISINGNADVEAASIKQSNAAAIQIMGSGKLTLGEVVADQLSMFVFGGGNIVINGGKVRNAMIALDGAAKLQAPDMAIRKLELRQAGASESQLMATETATVRNEGAGNVAISGSARCTVINNGNGSVSCGK
jgi:hypothetical protein